MLDPIAYQNRNRVAFVHAQGEQTVSELIHSCIQFAVGNLPKAILSGNFDGKFVSVAS
jgi:hypothetical protein